MELIIETLFDVGQEIWVPRVYRRLKNDVMVINGEEWYRSKPNLIPIAKMKKITHIEIRVSNPANTIKLTYWAINKFEYAGSSIEPVDNAVPGILFQHTLGSDDICKIPLYYESHHDALKYAEAHKLTHNKELFK